MKKPIAALSRITVAVVIANSIEKLSNSQIPICGARNATIANNTLYDVMQYVRISFGEFSNNKLNKIKIVPETKKPDKAYIAAK